MRARAIGIDFSGARDAGRRIWIAEGVTERNGRLQLDRCASSSERLNTPPGREFTLPALVEWVATQDAVIGCDFPFSLPRSAIDDNCWHDFVREFSGRYETADRFRAAMRARFAKAEKREPKRQTELPDFAATPWNPWNLRLYRQTHAGIGSVLAPLVGHTAIAPFDKPAIGRPLLVETCPASTLKALTLYALHGAYKGRAPVCGRKREALLDALITRRFVAVPDELRPRIIEDKGGDALDSIIAGIGAVAALPQIEAGVGYDQPIEGWVYYAGQGSPDPDV